MSIKEDLAIERWAETLAGAVIRSAALKAKSVYKENLQLVPKNSHPLEGGHPDDAHGEAVDAFAEEIEKEARLRVTPIWNQSALPGELGHCIRILQRTCWEQVIAMRSAYGHPDPVAMLKEKYFDWDDIAYGEFTQPQVTAQAGLPR